MLRTSCATAFLDRGERGQGLLKLDLRLLALDLNLLWYSSEDENSGDLDVAFGCPLQTARNDRVLLSILPTLVYDVAGIEVIDVVVC